MRYLVFYMILFAFCSPPDCSLNQSNIDNNFFKSVKWKNPVVDTIVVDLCSPDSVPIYYNIIINREKMLCDLTSNHLYQGQHYEEIKSLLGDGVINQFDPVGRIIFNNGVENYSLLHLYSTKLIYKVGINASGTCYFVLVFTNDNKFYDCYRVIAE